MVHLTFLVYTKLFIERPNPFVTHSLPPRATLQLIQASSDFAAPCVGNLPTNIEQEIFSHTQKYWAQRFFVFMKKLTELKTAMKDEKSLFLFEKFYL